MRFFLTIVIVFVPFFGCKQAKNSKEKKVTTSEETRKGSDRTWWKEGIVYQIYPRSFKDTDGDGIGDLRGIIEKLDYLKSLGVSIVWLNPIYASPNDDNGYDISDYRAIMDEFGTMDDFDALLDGMYQRGIKLVMDLVVNHTSNEHNWFQQSRSSRDNPYRDYYHWWPVEKGKPVPRFSFFDVNSDAWKYDSLTNAYYLHYFSQKQPDLKWENPKVRQEVQDIMKFWLDKGIDGFRMDAFQYVSKDTTFPKFPKGYEKDIIKYYGMGPNLHTYLKELNDNVISKYDIMTVAEGAGSTIQDAIDLVAPEHKELDMVYHFEGMEIGNSLDGYDLIEFKKIYSKWDEALAGKGWNSIFLANHDVPRMVSKFGNDSPKFRAASSKLLTTFILSMRGTPYYYYGDELGMTNIDFNHISEYKDIAAKNAYLSAQRNGKDLSLFMEELNFLSRDNSRTPMQWDTSAYSGFTNGQPWITVNPNYKTINVALQEKDPYSCLNYFKRMVKLRQDNPILVYGDYTLLLPNHPKLYVYTRTLGNQQMLVVLNFSEKESIFEVPESIKNIKELINNQEVLKIQHSTLTLAPFQAIIFRVE